MFTSVHICQPSADHMHVVWFSLFHTEFAMLMNNLNHDGNDNNANTINGQLCVCVHVHVEKNWQHLITD